MQTQQAVTTGNESNLEELGITKKNGKLWADSLSIADHFQKRHADVLRIHESLKRDCSSKFTERNFSLSGYKDPTGRNQPMFLMTRGGFSMLVMSFTGKKATRWKERYISAFDAMEEAAMKNARQSEKRATVEWQRDRANGKVARKVETDIIQEFVAYATRQGSKNANMYYSNLTRMTYRAMGLVEQGLKVPNGLRDMLEGVELHFLGTAEFICSNAIQTGMDQRMQYKLIYQFAKERVQSFAATFAQRVIAQ